MKEKEYRDRLSEADRELNRRGSEGRLRKRTDLMPFEDHLAKEWNASSDTSKDAKSPDLEIGEGFVPSGEGGESALSTETEPMKKKRLGLLTILFIMSVAFFVAAGAFAYMRFAGEGNVVSQDSIEIRVSGPLAVRGGDELSLEVQIDNKNSVPLQFVELVATYPAGTREPGDLKSSLIRSRDTIGTIPPAGFAKKTVKAVLFGEEGVERDITFAIEYRVPNSSAIFKKTHTVSILLSDSPINLSVAAQETINRGDDVRLVISVASNSTSVLSDMHIAASYPPGFTFKSSNISPIAGGRLWQLGDIAPSQSRTLEIVGSLEGSDGEGKAFRFVAGLGKEIESSEVSVPYSESLHRVELVSPKLALDLAINGVSSPSVIVEGGKAVRVDLSWKNNLDEDILDTVFVVNLSGELVNEKSIISDHGHYDSNTKTIRLTKADDSRLARLTPGASGQTSFSFDIISPAEFEQGVPRNPNIRISVDATAERLRDTPGTPFLSANIEREMRIQSALALSSSAVYSIGPFTNEGPIPPKVGEETMYTVIWSLSNAGSDLRNVITRAVLPSYMRYVGSISPGSELVVYTEKGGEIRWEVDRLQSGAGAGIPPRTVAFQIAFLPSITQAGRSAVLLGEASVLGRDLFTETDIKRMSPAITTRITTDPAYREEHASVVE
ncbi:MAG: hypothetical protein COV07_02890 [Candidatus Vogelbacteria bacterium CG10_big_fil_rev_8_21_14_0_10_45_14]|uniref:DUF11 domain-containing protein n=1 Tax=Candidatus Vogelbacteria bacterium CG10_big_fil_rev_8_21_14_0_10_45_14 TaxID=1975042 RepID=A0A2H0RJG5_9BACT|nr:MAG: hypothetical protein COV07_02890 [Candidatus Vogelbacteria bacterium CG10_big_fil_rev_8_21_14_0_10_45_14]